MFVQARRTPFDDRYRYLPVNSGRSFARIKTLSVFHFFPPLFFFICSFLIPTCANAQYSISTYEYWEYDCLTCVSKVIVEVTGSELKAKLDSKKMALEIYHKDFVIKPTRLVFGKNPNVLVAIFEFKLHVVGLQKYAIHVIDVNINGTRRVGARKIIDINVVQVPKLVDTATERCWPCLVDDDSLIAKGDTIVYQPTLTTKGFNVFVDRPRVLTYKGKKIKNGFDKYFLHVVRANAVLIDGKRMRKSKESNKFYLAVVSKTKKAPDHLRYLDSKALFIKGVEDDMSNRLKDLRTFKKYTKRRIKIHKKRLKKMPRVLVKRKGIRGLFPKYYPITDSMNILIFEEAKRKFGNAKDYYRLKKKFTRAKQNPNKLPKFFLRPYFSKRTLKYNIRPTPYGLPKIADNKRGRAKKK